MSEAAVELVYYEVHLPADMGHLIKLICYMWVYFLICLKYDQGEDITLIQMRINKM